MEHNRFEYAVEMEVCAGTVQGSNCKLAMGNYERNQGSLVD